MELRADCTRCAGLCCVALPFARSADFAFDKPTGMPCRHLGGDDRCEIHNRLRPHGFSGCEVFDCFGAGQQVVQVTFGGRSWRQGPEVAGPMFAAFGTLRAVHEMRWYLADARTRDLAADLAVEGGGAADRLAALSAAEADTLTALDVTDERRRTGELLDRVSATVRAGRSGRALRGADLLGRDLRGEALRGADLRGADLTDALFVTGPQLAAARGDGSTRIPALVGRPSHWP